MLPVVALALAAAPAAPPAPAVAALPPASGKIELARGPFAPRADAFVPGTRPHFLDQATVGTAPFKRPDAARIPDTFEVLFLARNRPVRVRIVAGVKGQTLNERFEGHLKELFAAADRDGDGTLNRYEVELIHSKTEFRAMLAGGNAFRGQAGATPALEVVDKDDDGRVSFEEFADYYTPEIGKLTQARPSYNRGVQADQYTPELFARMDKNKDGKLTEEELKEAEKFLVALDSDEDETVSGAELLANPVAKVTRLGGGGTGMDGMGGGMPARPGTAQKDDVQIYLAALPGTVVQQIIKRFDTDGDYELTAKEIALPKAMFEALDKSGDGKLSATELDAWRTGEPDAIITLVAGDSAADCKAEAVIGKNGGNGVSIPKGGTPDRAVLRVDKQTIDVAAAPLPEYARNQPNPYAYLFPADKQYLTEKDLVGPQFQFLRVAFDPADFDGDGKLTRAEFDRYFELQAKTARLGLTLVHATQVPNLFQLLDANADGRLSVKELRTAYERLLPLEPSEGKEITKSILQPSVVVRLGNTQYGAADQALFQPVGGGGGGFDPYGQPKAPTAGPVWFRKMDRNGDGDVSRAEWLGGKEEFAKLDANGDGLITLQEAEAFEAKARPKK